MISYFKSKFRYGLFIVVILIFYSIKVFYSFEYKHISYNQNNTLNDNLLNNIFELNRDSSIIDIDKISSILNKIDILNSYDIIKSIPNHIFIYFDEKIPTSIVVSDTTHFGLDQDGKIFDIWPLSPEDYNITTLDIHDSSDETKLVNAMEILHDLHSSEIFDKKINNIIITDIKIILTSNKTEIIFSNFNINKQLEKFYGFLKSELGRSFVELDYINLSFRNQIIIKNRQSSLL